MKLEKNSDDGWNLVTKKATIYFSFYHWRYDWALPLHVEIESMDKDYFEIRLHVLFFSFALTRISHNFADEIDKMFKGV